LTVAPKVQARQKLLDAALDVIREQGFAGTTVDELCARAGVTKGAFFHHFSSKAALGVAAAEYWSAFTSAIFAAAPYHLPADPLARVLGYVDFRRLIIRGGSHEFSCVAGTMVQETFDAHPDIRDACMRCIMGHADTLVADIEAARAVYGVADATGWSSHGLAVHTQAVIQGAFIVAKATGDADVARATLDHLRRYICLLFGVDVEAFRPSQPMATPPSH
jgi:TetR/AcrR family transcriptional repressor of nem operon